MSFSESVKLELAKNNSYKFEYNSTAFATQGYVSNLLNLPMGAILFIYGAFGCISCVNAILSPSFDERVREIIRAVDDEKKLKKKEGGDI